MLFNNFNWMDIENYLEYDNRVVVITGATEQHAYLSLTTDINTPLTIARAVCEQEKVLIAPPLPYGISPAFRAYPGTISLEPELFTALVRTVLEELLNQGFKKILISNGHGGNTDALTELLGQVSAEHPDAVLDLFEWWKDIHVQALAEDAKLKPNHANWLENLPFNTVDTVREMPRESKPPVKLKGLTTPEEFREALGDGSFGGPYQAADNVIEAMLNIAAEAMAIKLRVMKKQN